MKKPVTVYTRNNLGRPTFSTGFRPVFRGTKWTLAPGTRFAFPERFTNQYRLGRFGLIGLPYVVAREASVSDAIRWVALGVLPDEVRR